MRAGPSRTGTSPPDVHRAPAATHAPSDHVVDLDDPRAADPRLTGGKAANLAAIRRLGIRTLPGFVLTTSSGTAVGDCPGLPALDEAVHAAWDTLSRGGRVPLIVRSSSEIEDEETSSLAGQFCSVLDVRGWEPFTEAVRRVRASAGRVATPSPMAVLVQPYLRARCGGVVFSIDPVTGRADHVVVEVVSDGPEALVSGRAAAQSIVMTRRGRLLAVDHRRLRPRWRTPSGLLVDRSHLRGLARTCRTTTAAFSRPQDIEWAVDGEDELWVLQCRPVTATGPSEPAEGPVLGPGPLSETFPDPLRPLECDLWVAPLRDGVRQALALTQAVTPHRLEDSPVVAVVDGRVAADLELFGYAGRQHLGWRLLDPRVGGRRLRASWRVGVLRTTLAERAADTVADVDARLARVPPLRSLSDVELADGLRASTRLLETLHRDEVLAAALLPQAPTTAAAVALATLRDGRQRGRSDEEILRASPAVLALVPPAVGPPVVLPPTTSRALLRRSVTDASLGPREALRLRARWVQELGARLAWALGCRWAAAGVVSQPEDVALLSLDEVIDVAAETSDLPADLAGRRHQASLHEGSAPLPATFRLTDAGEVVVVRRPSATERSGVGAGGGRGVGPACHGTPSAPPRPGDVLVVRTLDPSYAPWLDGLAGLVSETGSILSHLAILARECEVPTVVEVPDAMRRFPRGARLLVDGTTGEVSLLDDGAAQDGGGT